MNQSNSKFRRTLLTLGGIGVLVICIVAVVGGGYYFYGDTLFPASVETLIGPIVTIQEPQNGAQITQGETFVFFASANDESGVTNIDLWVENTLVISQPSSVEGGITPLSLNYQLVADKTGNFPILVRAYNSKGEMGASTVHYVNVIEPIASTVNNTQYTVQAGDTLESIAAKAGVSVDSILHANPKISAGNIKPGLVIIIPMAPSPPAIS